MLHLSLALPLLRDPRAFQLVAGRDHLMVLDVVAAQAFQMVCDLFSRGCLWRHRVYLSVGLLWEPTGVLIHSSLLTVSGLLLHEVQHLCGNRARRVLFHLLRAPARWWLFVLLFLL